MNLEEEWNISIQLEMMINDDEGRPTKKIQRFRMEYELSIIDAIYVSEVGYP